MTGSVRRGVALANQAMARTGDWGNVEQGVKHLHAYGTGWGGHGLIEIEDPSLSLPFV